MNKTVQKKVPVFAAISLFIALSCCKGQNCRHSERKCEGNTAYRCELGEWILHEVCNEGECFEGLCVAGSGSNDTNGTDTDRKASATDTKEKATENIPEIKGEKMNPVDSFSVPKFGTGAPSVFTDIFVSVTEQLYLVNDQQQCEIVLIDDVPDFSADVGSFCARTDGYTLRGWTKKNNIDNIVDADSMSIINSNERTIALPTSLASPSGLAYDGTGFLVTDSSSNSVFVISTDGSHTEFRIDSHLGQPRSVTYDGSDIYVLATDLLLRMENGSAKESFAVDEDLCGMTVTPRAAYGCDCTTNTVYRYAHP